MAVPRPTSGTSITSLRLCSPHRFCASRIPAPGISNFSSRKQPGVFCCVLRTQQQALVVESNGTGRREAMLQLALATTFAVSSPARAVEGAPDDFRLYSDDVNKYKLFIPQGWEVGVGETDGIRSITAFYPDKTAASNVSVVITGLGPDYTRMESFGNVDAFAENLVSGLDRSWQRPPGVAAKLIDCKASKGLYYIEYTLKNPGESRRYIYSAIGMANNGWYNRLYTVTGQFVEEEAEKYSSKIEKAVKSFKFS